MYMYMYAYHTTGDEFKQYYNSVLKQQQLAVQEAEDVIKNLTRKHTCMYDSVLIFAKNRSSRLYIHRTYNATQNSCEAAWAL